MKPEIRTFNNRRFVLFGVLLLAGLIVIGGCKNPSSDDNGIVDLVSLVPDDNDISGWSRDGAAGEYNSIYDLFDAINGAALEFGDYDFREAAVQEYVGPNGGYIRLMISDQSDNEGSAGLYEQLAEGFEIEISDLGEEARGTLNVIVEIYFVEFLRANYYITVEINGLTDGDRQTAEEFGRIVDTNILLI